MWKIQGKSIGPGHSVFLIAEAGVNHNGDVALAHKLIDVAADAGADAVKFQTFITEEVVSPYTPLAGHHIANVQEELSHFELAKRLELPFEAFKELKAHCEEKNLIFISTPYDIPSAQFLMNIGIKIIKIASSEITNLPLLDVIANSGIPVILSTGMSTWNEIVESVNFLRKYHSNICVLKCTSNYPASPESINLRGIKKIQETFPNLMVGYSDHSEGSEISLTALGIGINIIERHFTLDKNAWGPDHKASMTPDEFKQFVYAVRKCEKALGAFDWDIQNEEVSQRKTMQKGVFARRDIQIGEKVGMDDVKFLRPSGEISPRFFFNKYKNKIATVSIPKNTELKPEMLSD